MFVNGCTYLVPDCPGLIFHLGWLRETIPGGPMGIWLEDAVVEKGPILRERVKGGVVFRFVAREPFAPPQPGSIASIAGMFRATGDPSGKAVAIRLDAGIVENVEAVSTLIEQAITTKVDPPALVELGERIVTDGYDFACEFIDILRQDFDQYWLRTPDMSSCSFLPHYSRSREKWCTLKLSDDLSSKLALRRRPDFWFASQSHYIPKILGEADLKVLASAGSVERPTFADEMLATALVELHQARVRSSILHAVIGYESAAKRGLEELMEHRLNGLESAAIVDAITREVSTATLGKVVLYHAERATKGPPLDWGKIDALYNIRNQIVHRGQRKMPTYEIVRDQIIEVRAFVKRVQAALRPDEPSPKEGAAKQSGTRSN
jgi:hypothetical protein